MAETVGFVGLGNMGKGMARNLLGADFPLLVCDLRSEPVDELRSQGARAANITEIGRQCNRIILILPDTAAVDSVLFGKRGLASALAPGQTVIDCGTTHPDFTRRAAETLARNGIHFLDAPVTGMQARAEDGTLTIMAGGNEDAFQRALPLLRAMGRTIVYMGRSGNGQLAKILNNVLFNISCAAMAEVLPLAARIGLEPEKLINVVSAGSGQSFGFDAFAPLVLRRNFEPGFPMEKARKDIDAILEILEREGVHLPVISAMAHTYRKALDRGLGHLNKGAMVRVWESALDIKVEKDAED